MPIILYEKQRQIVDYIAQHIQRYNSFPSLKDLADAFNLNSLATVHEHLQRLVKKGVLKKNKGWGKGFELVDEYLTRYIGGVRLPILGFIAAGQPIEPYTDPDEHIAVSPHLVTGKSRAFVLRVKGDSMIDEGILDGDYVVCEEAPQIKNGDIVVALLETGLVTLKRFFKEATRVRLEPANTRMSPIYATRVQIQGKVVGLVRKFTN
jgi:repressor LexA